ncbi:hypothetical protein BLOT_003054 [Blomia tropicalis]|nr:hypothetical protein BLOT_003054 [Blomia tropicalis]
MGTIKFTVKDDDELSMNNESESNVMHETMYKDQKQCMKNFDLTRSRSLELERLSEEEINFLNKEIYKSDIVSIGKDINIQNIRSSPFNRARKSKFEEVCNMFANLLSMYQEPAQNLNEQTNEMETPNTSNFSSLVKLVGTLIAVGASILSALIWKFGLNN